MYKYISTMVRNILNRLHDRVFCVGHSNKFTNRFQLNHNLWPLLICMRNRKRMNGNTARITKTCKHSEKRERVRQQCRNFRKWNSLAATKPLEKQLWHFSVSFQDLFPQDHSHILFPTLDGTKD